MKPEDILTESDLKVTEPRLLALALLMKAKKPLSIEEMQKKLRKKSPDKVTLYRMMGQFAEAGMVGRVDWREGFERFEFHGEHHHHHIVCTGCDRVEHVADPGLERSMRELIKKSRQFKGTVEHSLEFFGMCKKCARKR